MRRPSTHERRLEIHRDATNLIASECARPLTIEEVAARLATSRRQLQRAFAEAGATTFRAHLRAVRVARAAALLSSTDLPIAEVARRVGYHSPGQFSKAFRRELGESPSSLRARLAPSPEPSSAGLRTGEPSPDADIAVLRAAAPRARTRRQT